LYSRALSPSLQGGGASRSVTPTRTELSREPVLTSVVDWGLLDPVLGPDNDQPWTAVTRGIARSPFGLYHFLSRCNLSYGNYRYFYLDEYPVITQPYDKSQLSSPFPSIRFPCIDSIRILPLTMNHVSRLTEPQIQFQLPTIMQRPYSIQRRRCFACRGKVLDQAYIAYYAKL
jgi:hypothetical protein